jgi:hypothetical protein
MCVLTPIEFLKSATVPVAKSSPEREALTLNPSLGKHGNANRHAMTIEYWIFMGPHFPVTQDI